MIKDLTKKLSESGLRQNDQEILLDIFCLTPENEVSSILELTEKDSSIFQVLLDNYYEKKSAIFSGDKAKFQEIFKKEQELIAGF